MTTDGVSGPPAGTEDEHDDALRLGGASPRLFAAIDRAMDDAVRLADQARRAEVEGDAELARLLRQAVDERRLEGDRGMRLLRRRLGG